MNVLGNVHSIETCGTVDGPGVRFVLFLQGCPLRCLYCHNPDTWAQLPNRFMSADEILARFEQVKEFTTGGLTVTGGEPLLQLDFLLELLPKAKQKNIHIALDTAGALFTENTREKFDQLIKFTDLVLLDIKHIDDTEHKKLTGVSNHNTLAFARYLADHQIPTWIRHVVIYGLTFNEKYLAQLGEFLATLPNVTAFDLLPYHDAAKPKYQKLGIPYALATTEPLTKEDAQKARDIVLKHYYRAKCALN